MTHQWTIVALGPLSLDDDGDDDKLFNSDKQSRPAFEIDLILKEKAGPQHNHDHD